MSVSERSMDSLASYRRASGTCNIVILHARIAALEDQVANLRVDNESKSGQILSLQAQLADQADPQEPSHVLVSGSDHPKASACCHETHSEDYLQGQVERRTRELAMANEQLIQANEQITRNSQQQLKVFAMISHELRTPLNCIIGMSNLLLEEPGLKRQSPAIYESMEMITTSGDLLLAVINDVLDYSKLSTEGAVKTQMRPISLRRHLTVVNNAVRTQAQKAGLKLRFDLCSDAPDVFETDGRLLHQILFNLLGNAVKFGGSGNGKYIDFRVGPHVDSSGKEYVQFSIMDYGKGIAKDEQKKVFEPFQQASTNETEQGTGLGLAIVHKLVQVLGGTIDLKSEFGKFSNFIVKLPVKPLTASTLERQLSNHQPNSSPEKLSRQVFPSVSPILSTSPLASELNCASSDIRGLKVLVAEDNIVNQKVLIRSLQRIGIHEIDVVDNGQKAVDTWDTKDYQLVLMDMQMPVMDGIQATQIISQRKRERCQEYPKIVFLTAHALQEYQDAAAAAGGDGFISKPFKIDSIKSVLASLMTDKGAGRSS